MENLGPRYQLLHPYCNGSWCFFGVLLADWMIKQKIIKSPRSGIVEEDGEYPLGTGEILMKSAGLGR